MTIYDDKCLYQSILKEVLVKFTFQKSRLLIHIEYIRTNNKLSYTLLIYIYNVHKSRDLLT